jgi:hydrogenase expression/formation protein HypE
MVTLAHGAGGKAMRDLIEDVFLGAFTSPELARLEDQARLAFRDLAAHGDRLAFTTDSYVVDPLFFPGGDIGSLAVNGTVNDLAVGGARPLYLSCGFIIEEGFPIATLRQIASSMGAAARAAGVSIVTGDTKVVGRGAADKLFINTAGVGVIPNGIEIGADKARPGDVVLVSGPLGDHGAAILAARGDLAIELDLASDCRSLAGLAAAALSACPDIRAMRDLTRGGLAATLNEFALASDVCIRVDEAALELRPQVVGACELLGLDPLYLACEGALAAVVSASAAEAALGAMRTDPAGGTARVVGTVLEAPCGIVLLDTVFGGQRVVETLIGEQLPRIC